MAIGEALTNICSAFIPSLSDIKLSANWMASIGSPGEDAGILFYFNFFFSPSPLFLVLSL